jgi:outer membrane protein OmpA-like peptidoglycan-associated protein
MTVLSPSRAILQVATVAVLAVSLAACSSLPDELNPVEWIGAIDSQEGDDEALSPEMQARLEAERQAGIPGEEDPFPELGSVPGEAPVVTSFDEREAIAAGLVADRAGVEYTDNPADDSAGLERGTADLVTPPPPSGEMVPATVAVTEPVPAARVDVVDVETSVPPPAPAPAPIPEAMPEPEMVPVTAPIVEAPPPPPPPAPALAPAVVADADETSMPAPAAFDPGGVQRSMHAGVIYFLHGSTGLSERDRQVLIAVVEAHKAHGGSVRVVGHASRRTDSADSVKSKIANFGIAYDRARVVAQALTRLGVPADRIYISSMSDQAPAYSEATVHGEAANRRADIYLDFYGGAQ